MSCQSVTIFKSQRTCNNSSGCRQSIVCTSMFFYKVIYPQKLREKYYTISEGADMSETLQCVCVYASIQHTEIKSPKKSKPQHIQCTTTQLQWWSSHHKTVSTCRQVGADATVSQHHLPGRSLHRVSQIRGHRCTGVCRRVLEWSPRKWYVSILRRAEALGSRESMMGADLVQSNNQVYIHSLNPGVSQSQVTGNWALPWNQVDERQGTSWAGLPIVGPAHTFVLTFRLLPT